MNAMILGVPDVHGCHARFIRASNGRGRISIDDGCAIY